MLDLTLCSLGAGSQDGGGRSGIRLNLSPGHSDIGLKETAAYAYRIMHISTAICIFSHYTFQKVA